MYQPQNKVASHALRIVNLVTGGAILTLTLLLAITLCFASIPAVAQDRAFQVDPQYSFARLSLGSGAQSQQIDVAPVSGKVVFDSSDPADPAVDLNFKPASGFGQEYSEISFKSKRAEITRDGTLAVVGDLSVTRVAPSATWDPNEAYRGPEYGAPVVHTDTREVTLVFPGAGLPADQNAEIRLSASTSIDREDFPQFFAELQSSNTPGVVVDNENCTIPSTVGEDYSSLICTGTPVVTTASGVVTIALDLKLTPATSTASIASGAAGH
jgi:polyisoprenoid-binding protein YceI